MALRNPKSALSHLDASGAARMVDVSAKAVTAREAVASARVTTTAKVIKAIRAGKLVKGDALNTARIAGVLAAKRTGDLIPLCHPLPLDCVQVDFEFPRAGLLRIVCTARTSARTGVEMEALVGASVAALTIYDMAKSADKSIVIGPVQLERKSGGKSGDYLRSRDLPAAQRQRPARQQK